MAEFYRAVRTGLVDAQCAGTVLLRFSEEADDPTEIASRALGEAQRRQLARDQLADFQKRYGGAGAPSERRGALLVATTPGRPLFVRLADAGDLVGGAHNLDTLDQLQVLSVGNNLIAQLDNVMYLRPFTRLQAVSSFKGWKNDAVARLREQEGSDAENLQIAQTCLSVVFGLQNGAFGFCSKYETLLELIHLPRQCLKN